MSRLAHIEAAAIRHPLAEAQRRGSEADGDGRDAFLAILDDVVQAGAGANDTSSIGDEPNGRRLSEVPRHQRRDQAKAHDPGDTSNADAALLAVEASTPPATPLALGELAIAQPPPFSDEATEDGASSGLPRLSADDGARSDESPSPLRRIKAFVLEQATFFKPVQPLVAKPATEPTEAAAPERIGAHDDRSEVDGDDGAFEQVDDGFREDYRSTLAYVRPRASEPSPATPDALRSHADSHQGAARGGDKEKGMPSTAVAAEVASAQAKPATGKAAADDVIRHPLQPPAPSFQPLGTAATRTMEEPRVAYREGRYPTAAGREHAAESGETATASPFSETASGQPNEAAPSPDRADNDDAGSPSREGGRTVETSTEKRAPPSAVDASAAKPPMALPTFQLQRIADAIAEAAAAPATSASKAAATSREMATAPVRTMTIELHPTELGVVTVKLRLSGGDLSVALQASRPETARLLEHEEASLTKLLGSEGHHVDIVDLDSLPQSLTPPISPGQPGIAAPVSPEARDGIARNYASASGQGSGSGAPNGERDPNDRPQRKGQDGDPAPRVNTGNMYV